MTPFLLKAAVISNIILIGICIYFILVLEPINKQIKHDLPERPAPNIGLALFAFLVGFVELMSYSQMIGVAASDSNQDNHNSTILIGYPISPENFSPIYPPPEDQPPVQVETLAYTICPRDTLLRIAKHYGTSVEELLRLNPDIKDPNLIYVGQELIIPIVH